MADDEDSMRPFRRWARRDYLTKHEQRRRATAKVKGARRIDVTLTAEALDDYATVRRYVEGLNRLFVERNLPPMRLSATEIITMALKHAANAIEEA
jgi:hypothetical protein